MVRAPCEKNLVAYVVIWIAFVLLVYINELDIVDAC